MAILIQIPSRVQTRAADMPVNIQSLRVLTRKATKSQAELDTAIHAHDVLKAQLVYVNNIIETLTEAM